MPVGEQIQDTTADIKAVQTLSIPAIMACVFVLVVLSTGAIGFATRLLGGSTHRSEAIYGFAAFLSFLSIFLVMTAVYVYLNVGQKTKIKVISGFYTAETIADYFDQFWAGRDRPRTLVRDYRAACKSLPAGSTVPQQKPVDKPDEKSKADLAAELRTEFTQMFSDDFGGWTFVVPAITFIAAGGTLLFLGFSGGLGYAVALGPPPTTYPVQPFGIKFDLVTIAAIFGAYTWVASDAIVRAHQWTLHPADLAWYALRMIIAAPLGQALAAAVSTSTTPASASVGAFAAFVGSMFSLDGITKTLTTAATRLNLPNSSSPEERDDLIVKLAGVDEDKAAALKIEGISTIGQLVTVDPVRVSIRTGLPFEYILNLVDAALLWVFVGNALKPLAPLGIRGASDVLALDTAWGPAEPASAPLEAAAAGRQTADVVNAAAARLQKAEADYAVALKTAAAAQTAVAAAAANAGNAQPAADVLAQLQKNASEAAAAAGLALQARDSALRDYLTAAGVQPRVIQHHAKMVTALTAAVKDGGPGLTEAGFDTIRLRLSEDSYPKFIKKLLDA
jgi:hypothetical protein